MGYVSRLPSVFITLFATRITIELLTKTVAICSLVRLPFCSRNKSINFWCDPHVVDLIKYRRYLFVTMFTYVGKINWITFARNEQFTFVLPHGFKKGDPVGVFFQWTIDDQGREKMNQNWVGEITQADESTGQFEFFGGGYYFFTATRSGDWKTLTLTMRNTRGVIASSTTLELLYPATTALGHKILGCFIYTGKLDFSNLAHNEMITVIAPASQGFKADLCVIFQWSDYSGVKNKPETWVFHPLNNIASGIRVTVDPDFRFVLSGEVLGDESLLLTFREREASDTTFPLKLVYH